MIYIAVMFLPAVAVSIWVMILMVGRAVFSDKAKGIEYKNTNPHSLEGEGW